MRLKRADGGEIEVEILSRADSVIRVKIDGREVEASIERAGDGELIIGINGLRSRVFGLRARDRISIASGPANFEFTEIEEGRARGTGGLIAPEIAAPMPGKVLRILVSEGDQVQTGDGLIVLEAMKMETTLAAESAAIVKRVRVEEGQTVDHGAVLIELSPPPASSGRESAPRAG